MFNIPEDKLPPCLKDEQRINVLFSPLRSRSANPKDWDSKIESWKTIIKAYCESNDVYSFTVSSLNKAFIRNGRPPFCLEEVINDMSSKGEIQVLEVFLRKNASSWTGWTLDVLVKRPLSWSFNKLKYSVFVFKNTDDQFVHLEVVKSKSEELIKAVHNKYKNKLISLKELLNIIGKDVNKSDSVKLLLHHLINQQQVDVTQLNEKDNELDTFLIKVGDGHKVNPITEVDIGIYTLELNSKLLRDHIETMEDEVAALVKETKMHLAKNHKQMAKSSLKKKHDLEKRIIKKMDALHNIETLLQKIQDTHSDAGVFQAYKKALSAFNTTFKTTGISEDKIEDTMISLGDVLDQQEDIQSALAKPAVDNADDFDLEQELAELMADETNNANLPPPDGGINTSDLEKELENLKLPEVPDSSPYNSTVKEMSLNLN